MAKYADGPASGRMGFGYEAAKEAGLPYGAIRPRSEAAINADLRAEAAEETDRRGLLQLLETDHPRARQRAEELARLGRSPKDIVDRLKVEALERRRRRSALVASMDAK